MMRNNVMFGAIWGVLLILCLSCSEDRSVNTNNNSPYGLAKLRISPIYVDFTNESLVELIEVANRSSVNNSILDWKIAEHPEWITISKTSGLVENNSEEFISLSVDTTNLKTDTISHIKFTSNCGDTLVHVAMFFNRPIPSFIFEKTDAFIISRVGQDFFEKNFTLIPEPIVTQEGITYSGSHYIHPKLSCLINPSGCNDFELNPRYGIIYYMEVIESPFANAIIGIDIDEKGVLIREEHIGLPDCINNPLECFFPINADSAKVIAKSEGLEDGLHEWETRFQWYSYANDELIISTFAWLIRNILSESGQGEEFQQSGKLFIIDANSGELLQILNWFRIS
ncbi:MAG: hypothetical protein ACE5IR_22030 [bacterium]